LSNIATKSARNICKALGSGERSADKLCQCLCGRAKGKEKLLRPALEGIMNSTQQFQLNMFLMDWTHLESQITELEQAMHNLVAKHYQTSNRLLQTLPGVAQSSAYSILAEVGDNLKNFKTADHLTSWAGLSPGNKQSGSKWYSSPVRKGNKYLTTALIQVAWAAVRVKNSYWQAQFIWLKRKLPVKKALVAIARKFLKLIYYTLTTQQEYVDKGASFFLSRLNYKRNNINNQPSV
jgi:transposase